MSAFDDYKEKGGLEGIALSLLSKQLREAVEDPAHLLADVAEALSYGNPTRAAEHLMQTLSELPEGHPLGTVKMIFYTLPAVQAGYREAVEFASRGVFPDDFPPMLAAWGAVDAYVRERNTLAAKQPRGKNSGRTAMIEAMAVAKLNEQTFKEFERSAKAGSIDGLNFIAPNTYQFDCHGNGDTEYEARDAALAKCWEEAGKAQKSKIRS